MSDELSRDIQMHLEGEVCELLNIFFNSIKKMVPSKVVFPRDSIEDFLKFIKKLPKAMEVLKIYIQWKDKTLHTETMTLEGVCYIGIKPNHIKVSQKISLITPKLEKKYCIKEMRKRLERTFPEASIMS